jgi:hypothetical protein
MGAGGARHGFSYWVQADREPEGFAGPHDVWHTHSGLCVVNGWVEREEVADAAQCPGSWLAGGDLWMVHALDRAGLLEPVGPLRPGQPGAVPDGTGPRPRLLRPRH